MAVRLESVRLELEDNFTSGMARAAAAAAMLNAELDNLNKRGTGDTRNSNIIINNMNRVSDSANRNSRSINQLTGRLRLWADAIAALGPALVPIGAVATAGIMGLANQLGAAALAGGVAVTAFQGVGGALKALNTYQITPTEANLQKAREALENLSPAAAGLTLQLRDLMPQLKAVRDVSAENMFPGVSQALDDFETRWPDVERMFGNIAETLGGLAANAGAGLASQDFDEFFDFLATDVPTTLADLGRIVGNLTEGLANLWMAFDPLNDDFSQWMVRVSESFNGWAKGLDATEGFQEFIAYVRASGPEVAETFGALSNAIIQIVEAAAPIGGPVLDAVEAFANAIASIADSPFGPALIGWAAAAALVTRTLSITSGVLRRFGLDVRNHGTQITGFGKYYNAASGSVRGFGRDLGTVTKTWMTAGAMSQREAAKTKAASERLGSSMRTMGGMAARAGAGVAAFALVTSDLGESLHVQNTAMLGLMGTMMGPWGAAIGVTVGSFMDAAQANDAFVEALGRANSLMQAQPTDFKAQADAVKTLGDEYESFKDRVTLDGNSLGENLKAFFDPGYWKNTVEGIFGSSDLEEMEAAQEAFVEKQRDMQVAYSNLANEIQGNTAFKDYTKNLTGLQLKAESIQPALEALGYNIEDIANLKVDSPEWETVTGKIEQWLFTQDSVAGRTANVQKAIQGLDDELLSTATSADQLASALAALLGPGLTAEEAFDKLTSDIRALGDEMKGVTRTFTGNSDAAIKWREKTRGIAEDIVGMLTAQAKNGASSEQLARSLNRSRDALIREGMAAGFTRKQMEARIKTMGLTPKLIQTVFKAAGLKESAQNAKELVARYNQLPKEVRTHLAQDGFPKSKSEIEQLQKKYKLTPKQVRTILEARDNASVVIDRVTGKAKNVPRNTLTSLNAVDNASGTIAAVMARMHALDGTTATTYVSVRQIGGQAPGSAGADGGIWSGGFGPENQTFASGGFTRPPIGRQQPQIRAFSEPRGITWSEAGSGPWEAFVSGHPAKKNRSRTIADEVVGRLGGEVRWKAADGLLLERRWSSSYMASPKVVVTTPANQGPMRIVGTLDTPFGPAEVRGIVDTRIDERDRIRDRRARAGVRT